MKIEFNFNDKKLFLALIYLGLILAAVFVLRLYQLSFFEFKNDQSLAIILGNQARQGHFLVTHGMTSGVGFNNPPYFIYLMGLLTYFSQSPIFFGMFLMILNLLALALAFWYFCSFLPIGWAVLSGTLLAFSCALTMYSSVIWAQCMLPAFMILFHFCFYKFIKDEVPLYFIALSLLAGVAAQIHMSGFFLFGAIFILGFKYKHIIKKKYFILTGVLLFLIFLPYLHHLFIEGELNRVLTYAKGDNDIPWNIFRSHIWFTSFDFFRVFFRKEFLTVVRHCLGLPGLILYPLTFILPGLFVFGFYSYLKFIIKEKSLFKKDSKVVLLPLQISGFLVSVVTLGYLIFCVRTPLHYLIVLFPAHAVIAGFAGWKLWNYKAARIAIITSIAATVILLTAVLRFLDTAGGHWCQYGPSFKLLKGLRGQIEQLTGGGLCSDLQLTMPQKGKFDQEAIRFVLLGNDPCKNNSKALPIKLSIVWDEKEMRYITSINKTE